jgi:hypothetical protein
MGSAESPVQKLGVGVDITRYTDFSSVPGEATTEYNRARYEEVRERRDQARRSAAGSEVSDEGEAEEEREEEQEGEYHASDLEDGAAPKVEVRPSRRARSPTDLRDDAVRAATAAAQRKRLETRERRAGMSGSSSPAAAAPSDDTNAERLENAADRLHRGVMIRKFFHLWKTRANQQVVCRKFFEQRAAVFRGVSLLQPAFDTWKRRRWLAILERRAERRNALVLLAKTWGVWVRQTAAIVQRSAEMRQRILVRKYVNAWKDIVRRKRETEEKVRFFQLSCVMQRWKNAFGRRQEQEQQAIDVYENNLVTRIYWQWYFAHLNTAVPQQYEERLARTVLYEWREKADGIMQLHAMAEEFRRRKLLQRYFSHWVYRTDSTLEDQDRAMDYLEWNRQKMALDNWRKQATLAPLVKGMQDVVKDRILYEHFSLWRQRTKNEVVAAEIYNQNLVQKAFRNWRLALRHDIMAEHHERTILRNTMQHWVRQERLQLLLRTHNRKLARGVVGLMAQRLKEKKDRLRQSYRQVAVLHRRNTARNIFQFWYQKLLYLREREQMAENRYQTSLVEKALYIWRDRLQQIRDMEQQAADAYFYFRTTKILTLWRARAAEARKARLKEAYQIVARNRKRRTALEHFRRWRARSDQLWDLDQRANDFSTARLYDIGRDILFNWNARVAHALEQEAEAEELDYRRLVGMAFSVWNDNLRRQQELELRAQVMVQENHLKLLLKYLKRWDTRYSRICWRREDATREYERNQTAKALSIFRQWREKAYQRQQHNEDTFGAFGDHASTSSSAAPPPPDPGIVTPRRGFKTPGWKTTGGTTMRRGVLGNRNLVLSANTPIGSPGSPLKRFGGLFGRSTLGRPPPPPPPDDEDEGTLVGSGGLTIGSRSITSKGGGL